MSLRVQAEADLAVTLEAPGDFGALFTLVSPEGFSAAPLYGKSGDIGAVIDPETGVAVTGRHATLTARLSTLSAAGYPEIPRGIADASSRPWVAGFGGQLYKVKQAHPDRTLGVVTMVLEFLRPGFDYGTPDLVLAEGDTASIPAAATQDSITFRMPTLQHTGEFVDVNRSGYFTAFDLSNAQTLNAYASELFLIDVELAQNLNAGVVDRTVQGAPPPGFFPTPVDYVLTMRNDPAGPGPFTMAIYVDGALLASDDGLAQGWTLEEVQRLEYSNANQTYPSPPEFDTNSVLEVYYGLFVEYA